MIDIASGFGGCGLAVRVGVLRAAGNRRLVVGQRGRGRVDLAVVLVAERLVDNRGRRDRIVVGAELVECLGATLRPEMFAQVLQQVRVGDLAATALSEDAADQAGNRDDVLHAPVLRDGLVARGRVVGGQRGRIVVRLGHIGVHAGDVVLDHLLGELALRAVFLGQPVDLRDRTGLCVRGEQQLVVVHLLELAGRAEERCEGAFAVVPQHVHQEQPVLGLRVPGAERERLVGVAVDVRHVVGVAVDRHAGFRRLGAGDIGRFDPERFVVVVLAERRIG